MKSLSPQASIQFLDRGNHTHKGISPKREDSNNIKLQNVIPEKLKHLNKTTTGLEQAYSKHILLKFKISFSCSLT